MMKRLAALVTVAVLLPLALQAQSLRFAFITDTHLHEDSRHWEDLRYCIDRINADTTVRFTIFGGDVTNIGSDAEIFAAKALLDSLRNPYYVVAGNHDAKWSESGCNTFSKVFGYEHFDFEAAGIRFLGCNSGPNMRMAPALLPRESLLWLDSAVRVLPPEQPVIFVNHYPMDSMCMNWYQALNMLKRCNIQLIIGGHRHKRVVNDYSGVPGVLCDALERQGRVVYNVVEVTRDSLKISEYPIKKMGKSSVLFMPELWYEAEISRSPRFSPDEGCDDRYYLPSDYPWITYAVNEKYPSVKSCWEVRLPADIGSGAVIRGSKIVVADEQGTVRCLNAFNGKEFWSIETGSRIFSTPALSSDRLVVGTSVGEILCLRLRDGKTLWQYSCEKSVLATPVIRKGVVYCGASDGVFRALDLKNGALVWEFTKVAGFVECRPYVDDNRIIFGDWGKTLYCLETATGSLKWTWKTDGSEMYSPAAVNPVVAAGRVYLTTPRRKTYCLDLTTGEELWSAAGGRESIALSPDSSRVYVKDMFGTLHAFATKAEPEEIWNAGNGLDYDISPTPCAAKDTLVFVPSDKGLMTCMSATDGSILWQRKVSSALINSIVPVRQRHLLVCTMDGFVTMLKY